jgi:hypothetical protein
VVIARAPEGAEPEPEPTTGQTRSKPGREDPLLGRWRGVGVQDDQQQWLMDVTIRTTDAGSCADVEYPDVPCAGTWTCVSRSTDGTLEAVEHISAGTCIDGGSMSMRVTPEGRLEWSWGGSGIRARATLDRVPAGP